jgi:hypothetical protein
MKIFGSFEIRSSAAAAPPTRGDRSRLPPSTDSPMSWRSHMSRSWAMFRIANASPTTPSRRSSAACGRAAITAAGTASQ